MPRTAKIFFTLFSLFLLSSCSEFAKGAVQAVLEEKPAKPRECLVKGPAFFGIDNPANKQNGITTTKLMVVHGIGKHATGYSTRLVDNLIQKMGFDVLHEEDKLLPIKDPRIPHRILGYLHVENYTNQERSHNLLVYELTWSSYIEEKKKYLEYDDVSESAIMRASINSGIKKFFNERVTDPMIYLGAEGKGILASVSQSICWMLQPDWRTIGHSTDGYCDANTIKNIDHIRHENYFFATYSLGSHIVVRGLEHMNLSAEEGDMQRKQLLQSIFRDKILTVFMLANQLPLIQLGSETSKIHGQIPQYCKILGKNYADHWFNRLSIVAFSDPNDLLSYTIPNGFEEQFLDSRLCPKVTNVILQVTDEIKLPVVGGFASPQSAHSDYDMDERVIELMTDGATHIEEKKVPASCRWIETTTK